MILRYMMAALMTLALTWGNCIACFPSAKACCTHCPETSGSEKSARDCSIQPAILATAKAPDAAALSLVSSLRPAEFIQHAPVDRYRSGVPVTLPDRGYPPDLNLLHSILLI